MMIARQATLPELLSLLVAHGADALLEAEGIERHAESLLTGHATIFPHERVRYGDATTWAAWADLREHHGERLRELAAAHARRIAEENARRVAETTIVATNVYDE